MQRLGELQDLEYKDYPIVLNELAQADRIPQDLVEVFTYLNEINALTKKNIHLVEEKFYNRGESYDIEALKNAFNFILRADNKFAIKNPKFTVQFLLNTQNPEELAEALLILNSSGILGHTYAKIVARADNPVGVAELLALMNEASLLTAENNSKIAALLLTTSYNTMLGKALFDLLLSSKALPSTPELPSTSDSLPNTSRLAAALFDKPIDLTTRILCNLSQASLLTVDIACAAMQDSDPLTFTENLISCYSLNLLNEDELNAIIEGSLQKEEIHQRLERHKAAASLARKNKQPNEQPPHQFKANLHQHPAPEKLANALRLLNPTPPDQSASVAYENRQASAFEHNQIAVTSGSHPSHPDVNSSTADNKQRELTRALFHVKYSPFEESHRYEQQVEDHPNPLSLAYGLSRIAEQETNFTRDYIKPDYLCTFTNPDSAVKAYFLLKQNQKILSNITFDQLRKLNEPMQFIKAMLIISKMSQKRCFSDEQKDAILANNNPEYLANALLCIINHFDTHDAQQINYEVIAYPEPTILLPILNLITKHFASDIAKVMIHQAMRHPDLKALVPVLILLDKFNAFTDFNINFLLTQPGLPFALHNELLPTLMETLRSHQSSQPLPTSAFIFYLITHPNPYFFITGLQILQQNGLFDNAENILALTNTQNPHQNAYALSLLDDAGFLTTANRAAINQAQNPVEMARKLCTLQAVDRLKHYPNYMDIIIAHPSPDCLVKGLLILSENNMLFDLYIEKIASHQNPDSLATALIDIRKSNNSIEKQLALVRMHITPHLFWAGLNILHKAFAIEFNYDNLLRAVNTSVLDWPTVFEIAVSQIFQSSNPFKLANIFIRLQTNSLLSEKNINFVCKEVLNPDVITDMLIKLSRQGLLTDQNRMLGAQCKNPKEFASILVILTESRMIEDGDADILSRHNDLSTISTALDLLINHQYLTIDIKRRLLNHPAPYYFSEAVRILSKVSNVQPLDRQYKDTIEDTVFAHKNPQYMAQAVAILNAAGLLNDLILLNEARNHSYPHAFALACFNLKQAGLLSYPSIISIIKKHTTPKALAESIILLQQNDLLEERYLQRLADYHDPVKLATALLKLKKKAPTLLSIPNCPDLLTAHTDPEVFASALLLMHRSNVLNPDTVRMMIEERLLIFYDLWGSIPYHRLSRPIFDQLLTAAKERDPSKIQGIVNSLLEQDIASVSTFFAQPQPGTSRGPQP